MTKPINLEHEHKKIFDKMKQSVISLIVEYQLFTKL